MKLKYISRPLLMLGIVALLANCQKQDHAYKEFLEEGERIYIGKADNLLVEPGKNRVGLAWDIRDPRASQVKITYNDGLDSVMLPVNKTDEVDRMNTIINELDERLYSFRIYVLDAKGNQSVAQIVDGQSYGESYRQTLNNRGINRITKTTTAVTITWFTGNSQMQHTELLYYKIGNTTPHTEVLPSNSSSITLQNVDFSKGLSYRTAYLPSANALDTFYTDYTKVSL